MNATTSNRVVDAIIKSLADKQLSPAPIVLAVFRADRRKADEIAKTEGYTQAELDAGFDHSTKNVTGFTRQLIIGRWGGK